MTTNGFGFTVLVANSLVAYVTSENGRVTTPLEFVYPAILL